MDEKKKAGIKVFSFNVIVIGLICFWIISHFLHNPTFKTSLLIDPKLENGINFNWTKRELDQFANTVEKKDELFDHHSGVRFPEKQIKFGCNFKEYSVDCGFGDFYTVRQIRFTSESGNKKDMIIFKSRLDYNIMCSLGLNNKANINKRFTRMTIKNKYQKRSISTELKSNSGGYIVVLKYE